ncbi:Uncharacterised protein [Legionella hackeliae]|uniref:hypothetical protein n=1 Tax=Legionella hackeliae TaxID=449 RepID=UPI000E12B7DA|nr:hypothetical protein [Legionella hackeliae]STX49512.1 Uncharacterised protein [Legionella hackeliae]
MSPENKDVSQNICSIYLGKSLCFLFAYASGVQLIRTVFADKMWDDIRPALEDIAMPTLQILSFIPLMDLFSLMIRKSQAKFGSLENDDTLAARLLVKMSLIIHYIQQMKGEVLMQSINRYTPEQQQALGIDPEQFKTDLEAFSKLKEQMTQLQIEHVPVDIETPRGTAGRNRFFSAQTSNTPLLVGKAPIYG